VNCLGLSSSISKLAKHRVKINFIPTRFNSWSSLFCNRHRRGQSEDRPLSERATAAAWPTGGMNGPVAAATTVGPQAHVNQQASGSERPPAGSKELIMPFSKA
jgi:hypothetical protein